MMEEITDTQIEQALESAMRYAMVKEQTIVTIDRHFHGDLTLQEGVREMVHLRELIDNWQLGDPSPFGEIE